MSEAMRVAVVFWGMMALFLAAFVTIVAAAWPINWKKMELAANEWARRNAKGYCTDCTADRCECWEKEQARRYISRKLGDELDDIARAEKRLARRRAPT